jgi:CO/xanthine dehydrogenase FAD-binding subunit
MFRRSLSETHSRQSLAAITVERAVLLPDLVPQWIAVLLALDARVGFVDEAQEVALADFLRRVRPDQGKLVAVHVPPDALQSVAGEAYLTCADADVPTRAAIAVVVVTEGFVHQARLALSGVWREPARLATSVELLVGAPLNLEHVRRVTEAVEQEVAQGSNGLGGAGYRQAMAGMLSYCALEQCRKGASGL